MPVETDAIIKHLEEKENKEGTLPPFLQFYQKLLRVQSEVEQKIASLPKPNTGSEAIGERLANGRPLLFFDELTLDWPRLQEMFTEVSAVFAEYPELFDESVAKLREAKAERLLTQKAVKAWFEEGSLPSSSLAGDINENLLAVIIHAAIKPWLVSHARALIGFVEQERWRRPYCPICGGSPDFAFLDKERGSRWLLCSRCDTEWLFQRLECPYCGTEDQNALAYFVDDKGLYRLYVCEKCKRYLKTIDLRQVDSEVLLPLERLYTLDLDRQAKERGYSASDKV